MVRVVDELQRKRMKDGWSGTNGDMDRKGEKGDRRVR
jgi:hypothetical protein